jgi:lysophospholipase L1-like esterase
MIKSVFTRLKQAAGAKRWCISAAWLLVWSTLQGQPFAREVAAFASKDSLSFPAKKQILFIGSSSFTRWKDMQQAFPRRPLINRAFGGSTLADLLHYQEAVIYPYAPRQVVIYCGENDFAASDTVTVATVVDRYIRLFGEIRKRLPRAYVAYVSMKPSPSRRKLLEKYQEANALIRQYMARQKRTAFINVYDAMLDSSGRPISGIFTRDSLHMNDSGYAIWQKIIEPYLRK